MIKIKLRDFANMSEAMVLRWLNYYKAVEVTDDHGETILTDTQSLLLTWQGLIVHRKYNDYPYSIHEVLQVWVPGEPLKVLDDKYITKPLNHFLPICMKEMFDPKESDYVKMMIHVWSAKTNNLLTAMTERYSISVLSDDVIELMDDPGIIEIKRKVVQKEITIDEGEVLFIDYVSNSNTLDDNYFARIS